MKALFWNVRGLANSPTKLALQRLLVVNKPEFCFVSEPWMIFEDFPRGWFHRLGYKLLDTNNRNLLKPNLWCLCSLNLYPTTILITDQLVSFTFDYNNIKCGIAAVYASCCYLKRRQLWSSLQTINQNNIIPWCFIGDFNSILGAFENRGHYSPSRIAMADFQS
jgi:hypothetical protein